MGLVFEQMLAAASTFEGFNVPHLPEFMPSWSLQNSSMKLPSASRTESTWHRLLAPLWAASLSVCANKATNAVFVTGALVRKMPKLKEG